MSKWNDLYARMNADVINREIVVRHFEVTARLRVAKALVSSEAEMRAPLAEAYAGHFRVRNRTEHAPSPDDCYFSARQLLEYAERGRGGYEACYEDAKHGRNGGLYGVLAKLRDVFIREDVENYLTKCIQLGIDMLSYEDRVGVASEIRGLFKKFMSPEDKQMSEGEMAWKIDSLVRSLVQSLDQMRDSLGR